MSILVKFAVTGMSSDKYETVLARLEEAGAGAPPGRLYHVSFGSPDGLQVIDVYDSPESFDSFGRSLVPIVQDMGIQVVPEVHEAYKIIEG